MINWLLGESQEWNENDTLGTICARAMAVIVVWLLMFCFIQCLVWLLIGCLLNPVFLWDYPGPAKAAVVRLELFTDPQGDCCTHKRPSAYFGANKPQQSINKWEWSQPWLVFNSFTCFFLWGCISTQVLGPPKCLLGSWSSRLTWDQRVHNRCLQIST